MDDESYIAGHRAAWNRMLAQVLTHLGYDTPGDLSLLHRVRLISEREDAIAMLRRVCEEHGDNDWEESLHLADIIEKHLWRHLERENDSSEDDSIDIP